MRICIKRVHLWSLYSVMAATVFAGLVFMFLMLFQCKPLAFFWTRMANHPVVNVPGEGSCINMEIIVIMTYIYSVFAAICDFTVGILPIFVVRKLHMKRQTKIAVVGILSMACMYVTALFPTFGPWEHMTHFIHSASCAVIVRIPFVNNFNELDDFLCTFFYLFHSREIICVETCLTLQSCYCSNRLLVKSRGRSWYYCRLSRNPPPASSPMVRFACRPLIFRRIPQRFLWAFQWRKWAKTVAFGVNEWN